MNTGVSTTPWRSVRRPRRALPSRARSSKVSMRPIVARGPARHGGAGTMLPSIAPGKGRRMYTLYYAPRTCALASHIALEQSGAPYEAVRVDFAANQQRSPEYLRINPKGRVPALATPHGVLTENPAILQFLAQRHPEAGLAPLDDPYALATMNAFASYLCATVHVAHAHGA